MKVSRLHGKSCSLIFRLFSVGMMFGCVARVSADVSVSPHSYAQHPTAENTNTAREMVYTWGMYPVKDASDKTALEIHDYKLRIIEELGGAGSPETRYVANYKYQNLKKNRSSTLLWIELVDADGIPIARFDTPVPRHRCGVDGTEHDMTSEGVFISNDFDRFRTASLQAVYTSRRKNSCR